MINKQDKVENLLTLKYEDLCIHLNNKELKRAFPGSTISKKKLNLAKLDMEFVGACIVGFEFLKDTYEHFEIQDCELEGMYNNWDLKVKIKVW